MRKSPASLDRLRRRIDFIDAELVRLLSERARKAFAIGVMKKSMGLKIRDMRREAQVFMRISRLNRGPLRDSVLAGIYRKIMPACSGVQRKAKRR